MLIFFYGENFEKKSLRVKEVLRTLRKQRPDALYLHYDYLDISAEKLAELVQTVGLIEQKNIVLLSNIFNDDAVKDFFLENLELIAKSDNAFLLTEDVLNKRRIEKIKKHAHQSYDFSISATSDFNIFKLAEYLQKKDKKNLWLFFHRSRQQKIVVEEIFSILLWSLKTLALAKKFTATESGLKPFVYNRAQQAGKNWSEQEIEESIYKLIDIFHRSRFAGFSLEDSLEKFILEL